jgi:CBS domain-containing protein
MSVAHTTSAAGTRSLEDIRVAEVMHSGVLSCPFDTPLADVARIMAANRVHCVVGLGDPTDGEPRVWGVVTDRDVVAMGAAGGDVQTRLAGDTAATEVVTVAANENLRRAAQLMHEHGLSHLLVLEPGKDEPVGVLSTLDVTAAIGGVHKEERRSGGTHVGELMTTPVVTVSPAMRLKDVASILVEKGISGVPVVRGDEVLGVVSEADIVAAERGKVGRRRSLGWILRGDRDPIETRLAALSAGEAMTSPAITIEAWRSTASAATLMTERRVKRLPVLDGGRLAGIVTRRDLVRAFARPDAEIERDIREAVITRGFWLSGDEIAVEVHHGSVALSGSVADELVREALPGEVQKVPGVVEVTSTLTSRS